jgi:hypothetical protein
MYYIGTSPSEVLNGFIKRYFYGLRRNDDGELFLVRIDQLQGGDGASVVINDLGDAAENFPDFEEGIDFLEGIDAEHNIQYDNLRYQQMKWEGRALLYYIEPETGHFVQRISEAYTYPEGTSSPAYGEGVDEQVVPAGPGY